MYLLLAVGRVVVFRQHITHKSFAKATRAPDLVVAPNILELSDVPCFVDTKPLLFDNTFERTYSMWKL